MNTNVCDTCFSKGRALYSIEDLHEILNKIYFFEIKNLNKLCWECKNIILRFYYFRKQVLKIQRLQVLKVDNIKSFSSLSIKTKCSYDYEFEYKIRNKRESNDHNQQNDFVDLNETIVQNNDFVDNFNEEVVLHNLYEESIDNLKENRLHTDNVLIKNYVQDVPNNDFVDNFNKDKTEKAIDTEIYDDVDIKVSNNDSKLKKGTSKLLDDNELNGMFNVVKLTAEELECNREGKRNQPNFKKIPFKCDRCVLGFTRKDNFEEHWKKKHCKSIGEFLCKICQIRFKCKKDVEEHEMKHYICYRCALCQFVCCTQRTAALHCKIKHNGDEIGKIHCGQCNFVFRSAEELQKHKIDEHFVICEDCGKRFKGKHTLSSHIIRVHKSKGAHPCDICKRRFSTKQRLESHMTSHSGPGAQRLAYCDVCHVQYKNIHTYRHHLKNAAKHSDTYECKECHKRFASKGYYRKHFEFYHLHKSKYKCDDCDKIFMSDWRLRNHKQTHHGHTRTRNHTCNICQKMFYSSSTLREHTLIHSSARTYMCTHCGDTFKQRAALHTHSRLLHKYIHTTCPLSLICRSRLYP